MGCNYFANSHGDATNAVLAAVGYNFRRLLRWLELLVSKNFDRARRTRSAQIRSKFEFFTDDQVRL